MPKLRMTTESELQKYTAKGLREVGCLVYKFASPSRRGVPDLILIKPDGDTIYVEMKSPNGKGRLSKLQEIEIKKIRNNNAMVLVVESQAQADNLIIAIECEVHT